LFLGVDGFDLDRGVTTHFEPEAMLNRRMVENAGTVIAITDSSKFGKVCRTASSAVAEASTR
jgi:DeoR family transcriptional regulator of aga operon